MISYHSGDLLESRCEIICHQVNLQGVMSGGIAKQIATKYPTVEKNYINDLNNSNIRLGDVSCSYTKDFIVMNGFSQELNFDTNYSAIEKCFRKILLFAKQCNHKTIGVPFSYGCGIANGNWNDVEQIFKDIFMNEDNIDLQIWKYEEK